MTEKESPAAGLELPPSQPRPGAQVPFVSRFSVGRLHSLGNFEHVRYEVTVDVPFGSRASDVLRAVDDMLRDLSPKQPWTPYELNAARELLAAPPKTFAQGDLQAEEDAKADARRRASAERALASHALWEARREDAFRQLDSLGGTSVRGGGRRDDYDDEEA